MTTFCEIDILYKIEELYKKHYNFHMLLGVCLLTRQCLHTTKNVNFRLLEEIGNKKNNMVTVGMCTKHDNSTLSSYDYTITLYHIRKRPFINILHTLVHELAHTKHFDHGEEFLQLEKEYKKIISNDKFLDLLYHFMDKRR